MDDIIRHINKNLVVKNESLKKELKDLKEENERLNQKVKEAFYESNSMVFKDEGWKEFAKENKIKL